MKEQWYYGRNGNRNGPVDEATLQQLAGSGQLAASDLVWREGMGDWQPASNALPALFPNAPVPASAYSPIGAAPGAGPVTLGYDSPAYSEVQYVGFWWRVLASIIDSIVTGIGGAIIGGVIGGVMGLTLGASDSVLMVIELIGNIVGIIIGWLYSALLESSVHQATLGKMAIGVRVTDLNGGRISFARATGRHFAKILSAIILLIGFIMVAFTEKRQGLHDMIAGTLVVKGRPPMGR